MSAHAPVEDAAATFTSAVAAVVDQSMTADGDATPNSFSHQQRERAVLLRQLHQPSSTVKTPLLLPNVWDVSSARLVESAGFAALATTSAGIAFSLGYRDGERLSQAEMLQVVGRIRDAVAVPLTVDWESGFGSTPAEVAVSIHALLDSGAVGLNIEDTLSDGTLREVELQVQIIRAIREVANQREIPLVVNARTDMFWLSVGPAETRFDTAVSRLKAYRDAGADCLFAPGLKDASSIERLVAALQYPVNVLAGPGQCECSVGELQRIGVARISLGSAPMRACMGLMKRLAQEMLTSGTYETMKGAGAPTFAEANQLFRP